MKLESLKSSKFEAFKGSELQNSFKVMGGYGTVVVSPQGGTDEVTKTCTGNLYDTYSSYSNVRGNDNSTSTTKPAGWN